MPSIVGSRLTCAFAPDLGQYLAVSMDYVGYVRSDDKIVEACERRRPLLIDAPKAAAARDLYNVLMNGLQVPDRLGRFDGEEYSRMADVARVEARSW